jgi:hypothetical protein
MGTHTPHLLCTILGRAAPKRVNGTTSIPAKLD